MSFSGGAAAQRATKLYQKEQEKAKQDEIDRNRSGSPNGLPSIVTGGAGGGGFGAIEEGDEDEDDEPGSPVRLPRLKDEG
jgi:hypothetical protein